jgi:predicted unusual protein kinase regulating ubiquinone biosynthesis (AarF/ABC1/UbiB family)
MRVVMATASTMPKPPPRLTRTVPSTSISRIARVADIARFAAQTYGKTRLLKLGTATPEEVGSWIARESTNMGPLFVKLAQLVSARSDALDPGLVRALSVVQDAVDSEFIEKPNVRGYEVVGDAPLKAGSVASVWLARRTSDGAEVVIKKLHAKVREAFELDLPAIIGVLRVASIAGVPGADNFFEIVDEARPTLLRETDLSLEAETMAAYKKSAPACVVIPEVIESQRDYVVQEYVPSRKITEVKAPCAPLARRLMRIFVASLLEVGIVHGDPHPGNIGVLDDGRVVLYDWGVGVEVYGLRANMTNLVKSVAFGDLESFVESLQAIGVLEASGSDSYRVVKILEKLANTPPEDFHVSLSKQPEFSDSSGRRLVRFNSETVYLLRSLGMTEGLCRRLDPEFSYESYWEPDLKRIVDKAMADTPNPREIAEKWIKTVAASPETQRKTLDVVQQMNLELRDELVAVRTSLHNTIAAAVILLVLMNIL